jgi:hypothetical protein
MTTEKDLLRRVLEAPQLVETIRALPPRVLGHVVDRIGLEDSGEILALSTSEQLLHVFDESLWTDEAPGRDERLDPERFAVWLEVMLEAGDSFVSARLRELPEEAISAAFFGQILVLDLESLESNIVNAGIDEGTLTEKALDSCLCQDFDDYMLISRRHDGWDAVLTALLALDRDDHEYAQQILARCHHASTEYIEDNGTLYDVLTSAEMLEADAAAEREDRRARQGFVAPSAAASFLKLASTTDLSNIVASNQQDPITRMHFRNLEAKAIPPTPQAKPERPSADSLLGVLRETGIIESAAPLALPAAPDDNPLRQAMAALMEHQPALYGQRMEELAYVANILVAGASRDGRRYRPAEAAEMAIELCNEGLIHLLETLNARNFEEILAQHGVDKLFRVGWHLRS